jgi:hypothetical protein
MVSNIVESNETSEALVLLFELAYWGLSRVGLVTVILFIGLDFNVDIRLNVNGEEVNN